MSYTYSLTNSASGKFAINSTTGVVTTAASLTGLAGTTQNITVRATDDSGWFKDTTFGIQVTTSGYPELLDNGDFSSAAVSDASTGWKLTTNGASGVASISGGVLTLGGNATTDYGQADQSIATTSGLNYQLTWTFTGGNMRCFVGTTQGNASLVNDTNIPAGSITKTFTATSSTTWIRFLSINATNSVIDNASCHQV